MSKGKGWRNEPLRHSLASKGVKTGRGVHGRAERLSKHPIFSKTTVEKLDSLEVFGDMNKGYRWGLSEVKKDDPFPDYVEWFKTKQEREKNIKRYGMIVKNEKKK